MKKILFFACLLLCAMIIFFSCQPPAAAKSGNDSDNSPEGPSIDPSLSSDATLVSLTVSKGILQPAFSAETTEYLDAPVQYWDYTDGKYNTSVVLTVTAAQSGATITINGDTVTSGNGYTINNLAAGANTASIKVTAPSGIATKTYTVTVYRTVPVFISGLDVYYVAHDDFFCSQGEGWAYPRFTDHGDGTITDNTTGLMWLKNANSAGEAKTWDEALSHCSGTFAGYSDWRLPNIRELRSIMTHYGLADISSWFNAYAFYNVQEEEFYWSSTTYAGNTTWAWCASTWGDLGPGPKDSDFYIWLVRGTSPIIPKTGQTISYASGDDGYYQKGVAAPSIRFHNNGDGTITDNMTGITWAQTANYSAYFPDDPTDWEEAVGNCWDFNSNPPELEYHLSNATELESLVAWSCDQPNIISWLTSQGFTHVHSRYWTSTTSMYHPGYPSPFYNGLKEYNGELAWIMYLDTPYITYEEKTEGSYTYGWPAATAGY